MAFINYSREIVTIGDPEFTYNHGTSKLCGYGKPHGRRLALILRRI